MVRNKLNFIIYADDTTIYFDLEDFAKDNMEHQINDELKLINTSIWLKLNKLTINATKTKSMVFHRK